MPKDFFCKFCKKIQDDVEINEFEIFSMDKKGLIDLDLLEKKIFRTSNDFSSQ